MEFDNKKQPELEPEQEKQELTEAESIATESTEQAKPDTAESDPSDLSDSSDQSDPSDLSDLSDLSDQSDQSDPSNPNPNPSTVTDIESQDREWAKALSMEYNPPKPPPLPADSLIPPPVPQFNPTPNYNTGNQTPNYNSATPKPAPQFNQAPNFNMNSRNQAPQFQQPMRGGNNQPAEPMPPSHMVWAIISILCCCLPLGVVAIIYASKVSPLYQQGDIEGARKASETAEKWIIAAIVAGVVSAILYIPISMLFGPTVQVPQL